MHHGNLIYYPLNPNEESGNKDKSLITKHEFVPYMPPVIHINVNHIHQATKRPEQRKSKSFQLSNHSSHSMLDDRDTAPHHLHITIASNVSSKPFKFQFNQNRP